jgi:hypothetical protein
MQKKSYRSVLVNAVLGAAALAASPLPSAAEGRAAALPTGDEVIAKYESFLGGAAALGKVKTRIVLSRRIDVGAATDEMLVRYSKAPMFSIMYHTALDNSFTFYQNGCDGKVGWSRSATRADGAPVIGPTSQTGNCEEELYYYGYFALNVARLKANVKRFEVMGTLQIVPADPGSVGGLAGGKGRDLIPPGPRQVYLVLCTPARGTDNYVWLYFDTQTGALLRRADAGKGPTPVTPGTNPRFTDFIQYRDVGDGTRATFQFVSTAAGGSRQRGVHTDIVDDDPKTPMSDELFNRPYDVNNMDKDFCLAGFVQRTPQEDGPTRVECMLWSLK